jgi:two-component system, response regulator PdtaR
MGSTTKPKWRVLIVEDEFIVGLHLESILERLGHEVVGVVAEEAEALHLIATERPDLIVTDVHLAHGGDGLKVAREAQETYGARTIVITGHRDGSAFVKAEEAGARAFLRKPFGLSEVENVFSHIS